MAAREPLIKSIMNRVADKNRMIARCATQVAAATRYCVAADCGSSRLLPFPHRRCAHRVMAAVILRCQGAQHRERPLLSQPSRALALPAVCGVRLRHVTAQQPIAGAAACNSLPHQTLTRTVSGVRLLAKGMTIRVSPLLNPLPLAGEEAIVLSPACGGKLERGLAFLAYSPADTLPRSGRLREAGHRRHSRAKGLRPPCHAAYPAKPNARPCGT